jgi:putative hemolysin
MTPTLLIWAALIGLFVAMLASTLAYAIRTLSRVEIEQALAKRGRVKALDAILSRRHDLALSTSALRMLATCVTIVSIAFYFYLFFDWQSHPFKVFGTTILLATPLLLICTVAIPQAWAKYAGEATIASLWPLIRVMHRLLYPLVVVMNVFDEIIRRLSGVSLAETPEEEANQANQEILAVVSDGIAEGNVNEDQRKMIEGVISFRDLQAGQIMTPRPDIVALDVNTPLLEARDRIVKDGLSRLPVFEGTLDNVIGILYAKDLLQNIGAASPAFNMRALLHPPLFVPRTKPLHDLLREFRLQQVHIAIVLDEYGGAIGLVTSEDIIEEIVGDIADEYESPERSDIKRIDENVVEVDARINITDLNRELELHLPEDQDYQTLGGFVISTLGEIPKRGQTVPFEASTITVIDGDARRVKRLKIEKTPKADHGAPTAGE